eukprot:3531297-Rhodomonas_salina.2
MPHSNSPATFQRLDVPLQTCSYKDFTISRSGIRLGHPLLFASCRQSASPPSGWATEGLGLLPSSGSLRTFNQFLLGRTSFSPKLTPHTVSCTTAARILLPAADFGQTLV